jgi:hypothetical protein
MPRTLTRIKLSCVVFKIKKSFPVIYSWISGEEHGWILQNIWPYEKCKFFKLFYFPLSSVAKFGSLHKRGEGGNKGPAYIN